ncbi:MAG: GAF domain-containing sensor histidine kinase [Acidimicrobiales bacterium]
MPFRRIRDVERLRALVGAMLVIEQDLELSEMLRRIVQTALDIVGARYGALGVLDDTGSGLVEFVHVGMGADQVAAIGHLPEGHGILGLLIKDPRPLRMADLHAHPESAGFPDGHPPMSSFLGVPVTVHGEAYGNLYLTEKLGGGPFTEEDEDVVGALALAAGLAIDKARVHARLRDLTRADERERIARDRHDPTLKHLFAVGLALQGAIKMLGRPEAGERLRQAVDDIDETIREIRTTIFAIDRPRHVPDGTNLRADIGRLVEHATTGTGVDVRVDFDGPIDVSVGRELAQQLLLSIGDAVTYATRAFRDAALDVAVSVDVDGLHARVSVVAEAPDPDGDGTVARARSALASLEERARAWEGSSRIASRPQGGLDLIWEATRLV